MSHLLLRLFGTFHATLDKSGVISFRSDSERALLVYLAMNPDRPHSRESLASLLWPDVVEDKARNNLRVTLFRLRKALTINDNSPGWLHTDADGIFIAKEGVKVDALAFDDLVEALDNSALVKARKAKIYKEAGELYRGEFLQGFNIADDTPFGEWSQLKREQFHRTVLMVLWKLADYYQRRGNLNEALKYAQRQLEFEPWREEAHRQLMRVLAMDGERTAALAQYEVCRRVLEHEFGVLPTAETELLRERIEGLYLTPSSHLPQPQTMFVGRKRELGQLGDLLADPINRLISLVGPGGCGKSRLALQLSHLHIPAFMHGVHWVDLAVLDNTEQIFATLASTLEFSPPPGCDPVNAFLDYLAGKEMLLILDNFEHLINGVPLVDQLLDTSSNLRLITTSRTPLLSTYERVFLVEGLSLEVEGPGYSDAVCFFESVARRTNVSFHLTGSIITDAMRLCALVGGLPLAIEMAAVLMDSLTAGEIAERILSEVKTLRLDRNVPTRHSSMQAVFASSWDLLSEDTRSGLTHLSVFSGPFDFEAASTVAGVSLSMLRTLVNRSLLRRMDDDGGKAVYSFHPLVKEFARQYLSRWDLEAARDAHLNYYHNFMVRQRQLVNTAREPQAMRALDKRLADVRRAIEHANSRREVTRFTPLLFFLVKFYDFRADDREAEALFEEIVNGMQSINASEVDLSQALICLAWYKMRLGLIEEAESVAKHALELATRARDPVHFVFMHVPNLLGLIALNHHGDVVRAASLMQDALEAAYQYNDAFGIASFTCNLGYVTLEQGNLEAAEKLAYGSLNAFEKMGDRWGEAAALGLLGNLFTRRGEYERAERFNERLLKLQQEIDYRRGVAKTLYQLGELTRMSADFNRALPLLAEALVLTREIGEVGQITLVSVSLTRIYLALGDLRAAKLVLRGWLRETRGVKPISSLLTGTTLLAQLAMAEGSREKAIMLLTALNGYQIPDEMQTTVQELASRLSLSLDPKATPKPHSQLMGMLREFLDE
jgi:DNA-binding SARP family transcriptional activator/predicted ATPase